MERDLGYGRGCSCSCRFVILGLEIFGEVGHFNASF